MLSKGSNLLKYQYVTLNEDDARIIDYNDRIAEKIAELSQNLQEEMKNDNPEEFADGFSDGLDAEQVSALLDEDSGNVIKAEPVYDGPSPEELIEQAKEQADCRNQLLLKQTAKRLKFLLTLLFFKVQMKMERSCIIMHLGLKKEQTR